MTMQTVGQDKQVEVVKNNLGWGGVVKHTTRPYAVWVRGHLLRDKADRIRTFSMRSAAKKAGDQALETLVGSGFYETQDQRITDHNAAYGGKNAAIQAIVNYHGVFKS